MKKWVNVKYQNELLSYVRFMWTWVSFWAPFIVEFVYGYVKIYVYGVNVSFVFDFQDATGFGDNTGRQFLLDLLFKNDPDFFCSVIGSEPYFNESHFFPLVDNNADDFMINIIAYKSIAEILPDDIREFFLFFFVVSELNEKTSAVEPFLPKRFACLVE